MVTKMGGLFLFFFLGKWFMVRERKREEREWNKIQDVHGWVCCLTDWEKREGPRFEENTHPQDTATE